MTRRPPARAADVLRFTAPVVLSVLPALHCAESPVGPAPIPPPLLKGFTYTSFTADGFTRGEARNAVAELSSQIGNSWIALTIFEYQSGPSSHDIAPNTTGINPVTGEAWPTSSTEADLRAGVRSARAAGMKILLKPQIDLYTGEWRAAIRPGPDGGWFRIYTALMEKYARLAQELRIELLCVGTEFVVATQSEYTEQWRSLIAAVRRQYAGGLVYAANWNGAEAYGVARPEYEQVEFWKDLDYVGIDAYLPLTDAPDDPPPPFDASVSRAMRLAQGLGWISAISSKPVIITEVGLQSVRGALAAPWNYSLGLASGAVQDVEAQEFYYRVMIEALGKQPWCAGMFWWNWESLPSPAEATNYTPRNKPAAATLRAWYTSGQAVFAGR